MYGQRQSIAPVKAGDELDVSIEAVGEKGDGIARVQGFVIFVPATQKGQRVKIRITKVLRSVGFAEVIGKAETTAETEQAEQMPQEEPEPAPEDTENFGEDDQDIN